MNKAEAINALEQGKYIQHITWQPHEHIHQHNDELIDENGNRIAFMNQFVMGSASTGWSIVNPEQANNLTRVIPTTVDEQLLELDGEIEHI